jgi:hypothetical protein
MGGRGNHEDGDIWNALGHFGRLGTLNPGSVLFLWGNGEEGRDGKGKHDRSRDNCGWGARTCVCVCVCVEGGWGWGVGWGG